MPGLGLGPVWSKNGGVEKTRFCGEMISPWGDYGDPPEGNGLYGAQEAFGQVISPKPARGISFTGISPFEFPGKLAWAPWALPVDLLLAPC